MIKLKVEKKEDGNVLRMFEDDQPLTENELCGSVEEILQTAEYATARQLIVEKILDDDVKSFTSAERVLFAFLVLFDEDIQEESSKFDFCKWIRDYFMKDLGLEEQRNDKS